MNKFSAALKAWRDQSDSLRPEERYSNISPSVDGAGHIFMNILAYPEAKWPSFVDVEFLKKLSLPQDQLKGLMYFQQLTLDTMAEDAISNTPPEKVRLFLSLVYHLHSPIGQGPSLREAIEVYLKKTELGEIMSADDVMKQKSAINELSREGLGEKAAIDAQTH